MINRYQDEHNNINAHPDQLAAWNREKKEYKVMVEAVSITPSDHIMGFTYPYSLIAQERNGSPDSAMYVRKS